MPSLAFVRTAHLYTPLFCEENIWQLIHSLSCQGENIDGMWVLILTNPAQKVPLMNQRAVKEHHVVVWDYHVVLLAKGNQMYQIVDFDTRLSFASALHDYIGNTLIEPEHLPEHLHTHIRKIPASAYLNQFYSDRSHMLRQIDSSEFPDWPVINAGQPNTISLADYLNLEQTLNDGSEILKPASLTELLQSLSGD